MSDFEMGEGGKGDARYYARPFNFRFIWNLAHKPRRRIFERFMKSLSPRPEENVLDLGTADLPEPLENMFEVYYPHPERITAAGVEDCSFLEARHPGLKFVRLEEGKPLPFADDQFAVGFSNGVIEHVGSRERQAYFLSEFARVCRRLFVATPNRWFPVELHTRLPFLHWLPPPVFRSLLRRLGFGFYAEEANLNLLTGKELLALAPKLRFKRLELSRSSFFGLPSNLLLIMEKA
jgi:SAM-dependent methyltransferase